MVPLVMATGRVAVDTSFHPDDHSPPPTNLKDQTWKLVIFIVAEFKITFEQFQLKRDVPYFNISFLLIEQMPPQWLISNSIK